MPLRRLTLAFCCVAAALIAQTYPPPFPRDAARKLFENDRVSVWDVTWPKNQPTAMHEHPVDQLSVTLAGGTVRVTRLGGTPLINYSQVGSVAFTPKGTVHIEEGISDVPQRKIMLQLKTSQPTLQTSAGAIPPAFPREGARQLMDNARITAWDFTWKSGQKTARHVDLYDAVIVFLEGGTIRYVTERGASKEISGVSGEAAYLARNPDPYTEEAVQGSPHAVIVELK